LRMPPGFCANAAPPPDIEISNALAATAARKFGIISLASLFDLSLRAQRSNLGHRVRLTGIASSLRSSQ
jgi:hypothetical protein